MSTEFVHPTIGPLKAKQREDNITQFLGLQYATLADRFSPAIEKVHSIGKDVIDATAFGYDVSHCY